jgi:ketosteroid isomerase-like protein
MRCKDAARRAEARSKGGQVDTQAVLDHHLSAFAAGDTDMALDDYTDDSVLFTPDGIVRGREALRSTFASFFSGLFAPGTYDFTMDRIEVAGDVAYITWQAKCAEADVRLGTDTFVVRDGKIAVQTFAALIETR